MPSMPVGRTLVPLYGRYTRAMTMGMYRRMPAYQQMAIRTAGHAWRNRRALQAAGKIARWGFKRWRAMPSRAAKRRRIRKNNIGDPPRRPSNRADINTDRTLKTRTLYTHELTDIDRHTSNTTIGLPGARNSNVVIISGFKYCFSFSNNLTAPLQGHIAVIIPKQPDHFDDLANRNQSFFRAQSGTTRETDFNTGLTALEFRCLPINAARFHILHHERFTLGPLENGGENYHGSTQKSYTIKEKWVNLGRRKFTYTGATTRPEQPGVYIAYWFDQQDAAANAASVQALRSQERFVVYWRDTFGG